MKRMRLIVLVGACFVLLVAILSGLHARDQHAPRFVPVQTQPTGPYSRMDYGWGDFAPVRDGKVRIWAVSGTTNLHIQFFLYDLTNRRVIGELLNANPVFENGDQ